MWFGLLSGGIRPGVLWEWTRGGKGLWSMVVGPAGWLSDAAYVCSGMYCGGEAAEEIEGGRGGGGEVGRAEG